MKVSYGNGIAVALKKSLILLDPKVSDFISFVSHAHGDHIPYSVVKEPFLSAETLELIKVTDPFFKGVPLKKKVVFDDFVVKLLNAGHILGSKQIYIEADGKTLVYSGDIKLSPSWTAEPIEIEEADVLITETTYGYPGYRLPDQKLVKEVFVKWVKNNLKKGNRVEIGAYQVGKAQEAIKILNEEGIIPKVTETIRRFSDVYRKFGIKLEYFSGEDKADVLIKPMRTVIRSKKSNVKVCVLTGWSEFKDLSVPGFPISDHCDFYQLIEYVRLVNPKVVICTHGYSREFCKEVSRVLGKKAYILEEGGNQANLNIYSSRII
ncbi:MAG: hypothetical protein J7L39_03575 [Candidatus Aenigmarchaeota archaeon]|nr:hypothetical protein [Candidatus Aenigmarchaeota archaeon]